MKSKLRQKPDPIFISRKNSWKWKWSRSVVSNSATPWNVAPPSMGFSRQEYCSGLPFPSPFFTSNWMAKIQSDNTNCCRGCREQDLFYIIGGFPCDSAGKELARNGRRPEFDPWVRKIPWRRERLPTPVLLPGEFHGLYSSWGRKESDMTEQLSLFFTLLDEVFISLTTRKTFWTSSRLDIHIPSNPAILFLNIYI